MKTVQISKKLKNFTVPEIIDNISELGSGDYITNNVKNILSNISDERNAKLVLYVIHTILKSNNLSPKELRPTPEHGIQLSNPTTKEPYGIYHIHLRNKYVLIWYLVINPEYGNIINFEYMPHPPPNDDYRTVVKDIYNRGDFGYNSDKGEFFMNIPNIIKESNKYISLYKQFINNINYDFK